MNRNKNQRLTKEEKEQIKELTLDKKSLREIVRIMDLNLSTIYYQVRKFKPKQKKAFKPDGLSPQETGELVGAFAGDGSYYHTKAGRASHYKIRYSLCLSKDRIYSEHLSKLLNQLNLKTFLVTNRKGDSCELLVNSKDYGEFLKKFLSWEGKKTYSVCLKEPLEKYDVNFLKGFARGLMDTDGFVESSNVAIGCVSKGLIEGLLKIFDKFQIGYKLSKKVKEGRKDLFLVRVPRRFLDKYSCEISFSNPYKLQKLNSILKK